MTLELVPIGDIDRQVMRTLAGDLQAAFSLPCEIMPATVDPAAAFHWERKQHHSSELLHAMQPLVRGSGTRLLGVADVDLYIPILTFVFGEAQMGGPCAVVSRYRLRQEFYGLPPDSEVLRLRLLKEAVHELGHTFGLVHCDEYQCAMASSHAVEWIDLKSSALCATCREQIRAYEPGKVHKTR